MKILHYLSDFSLPSETFVYDLITNLENKGVKNIIITDRRHLEKERPFKKTIVLKKKGLKNDIRENVMAKKIYDFVCSKKSLSLMLWPILNKSYSLYDQNRVLGILKEEKPDVIYAHFGPNAIKVNNLLIENKIKIPLVAHFHGTDLTSLPYLNKVYLKNLKKLKENKNLICLVNSHFLERKLLNLDFPKKKIRIVYNTFNSAFSKRKKKDFFQKGKTFKIVNVSRFINFKGHKYLIDAFKKIVEIYPKSRLILIGDGEKKGEMINYSKSLGIYDKIDFKGSVPHMEISKILKECDVYVQPSIKDPKTHQEESFGIVLLETIASGIPVIVTNTGGMPEVVGKETKFSFIVKQKDSEDLFNKLNYLVSGDYKFSSNQEYAKEILTKFSNEKFISRILKSIEEVRQP
ncbi:MAG: glycosyltransferase family 4 protein [Candidatus Pacearchaeota archaeon]